MKKQYCTYEISYDLKELGFDEPCMAVYYPNSAWYQYSKKLGIRNSEKNNQTFLCTSPMWQQAIDFIREKYNYEIQICFKHQDGPKVDRLKSDYYDINIYHLYAGDAWKIYNFSEISNDFKYAREFSILKAIEIIKIINEKS